MLFHVVQVWWCIIVYCSFSLIFVHFLSFSVCFLFLTDLLLFRLFSSLFCASGHCFIAFSPILGVFRWRGSWIAREVQTELRLAKTLRRDLFGVRFLMGHEVRSFVTCRPNKMMFFFCLFSVWTSVVGCEFLIWAA